MTASTVMAQVIIRNLDDSVVTLLKVRAHLHGNSLEHELREILAAAARPSRADLIAAIDRIRAMTPAGESRDSVDLVREDRER